VFIVVYKPYIAALRVAYALGPIATSLSSCMKMLLSRTKSQSCSGVQQIVPEIGALHEKFWAQSVNNKSQGDCRKTLCA
jgi:hypothetical protein